jgi:hypothetical protein
LRFQDFPHDGEVGEWLGDQEVRITGRDGAVLFRRQQPRAAFHGWRRQVSWDALDFIYFAGYAMWNYLLAPFLLLRRGFRFEELSPLATRTGPWARIRVTFPPDVPTHSRLQDFYFDADHRLRRLDYTAEVVGRWAHAAHTCDEYREFEGFLVPTRRSVKPLPFGTTPLRFPTLVAIEVHSFRPIRAA